MIEFYKKQIFLSMVFLLLFSCDVEEKVKGKIDEIDRPEKRDKNQIQDPAKVPFQFGLQIRYFPNC